MKDFLLLIACLIFTLPGFSQDKFIEGYEASSWLKAANEVHRSAYVSKWEVMNPPNLDLPENFMDTLKTYDWINVGVYRFHDKTFGSDFNKVTYWYTFMRIDDEGLVHELRGGHDFPDETPYIGYRAISRDNKARLSLAEANGHTFLLWDWGKRGTEHCRIVSFNDGVLVYDVTRKGRVEDINSSSRFRIVTVAIPRMF